eukprot:jgi/Tetstr1/420905/TSEL_011968.t1
MAATSALLVVDMQNDFCLPGAVLQVAGAMGCLPNVQEAVEVARGAGVHVVWVIREHDKDGVDVERSRAALFRDGAGACIEGTPGAKLVEGLEVREGDRIVVKRRFSAFFGTNLDLILRRLGVTHVVVAGVQTPNCIRATAFDAMALDYHVAVLSDASAAKTTDVHEANLFDMRQVDIHTPTVAGWKAQLTA